MAVMGRRRQGRCIRRAWTSSETLIAILAANWFPSPVFKLRPRARSHRSSPCQAAATPTAHAAPTATAAPTASAGPCLHHLSVVSATTMRRMTASADPTAPALIASVTSDFWQWPSRV